MKYLLTPLLLLIAFSGVSQQLPLRYKTLTVSGNEAIKTVEADSLLALQKLMSDPIDSADTNIVKKIYAFKSNQSDRFYADTMRKIYEKKVGEIDKKYDLLRKEALASDNNLIENQLQSINDKEELEIKSSQEWKNLSITYHYSADTKGHLILVPANNPKLPFSNVSSERSQLFFYGKIQKKNIELASTTNFVFSTAGERVSAVSELFTDFFGPVRVSLGALISNNQSTTTLDSTGNSILDSAMVQNNTLQEFLSGGGNAIITASYPLLSYTSHNQQFNVKAFASPKASFDVPALGGQTSQYGFNADLGADLSIYYIGKNNALAFFANLRSGYVMGNKIFYNNLLKRDEKPFSMTQLSLGISVNAMFRISWTNYLGGTFIKDNFQSMISFSIIPQ